MLRFAHATPVVMNQYLFKSPGFDAARDFTPVVRVGTNPMMIAVNPGVPGRQPAARWSRWRASPTGNFRSRHRGRGTFRTGRARPLNQVAGLKLLHRAPQGQPRRPPRHGGRRDADLRRRGAADGGVDRRPPAPGGGDLAGAHSRFSAGAAHRARIRHQPGDVGLAGRIPPRPAPARGDRTPQSRHQRRGWRPEIVARLRGLGTYEPGGTQQEFDRFMWPSEPVGARGARGRIERE